MSDEVERGCGGVPVDDDRLRVHCSRCYRFDTVADHLERARAESASLRERAERAEADAQGGREYHETYCQEADKATQAALADAAALREQLGRVSNEVLRLTNRVVRLGMDLATAKSLALTNGEALAGPREALQSCVDSENALRAERDELRGLLVKYAHWLPGTKAPAPEVTAWLAARPAIPEGTPDACAQFCVCCGSSSTRTSICPCACHAPEGPPPGERGTP